MAERRSGLVPYLFYDDAGPMADWYAKVFGFEELSRYTDATGRVTNAEMRWAIQNCGWMAMALHTGSELAPSPEGGLESG
jgi:uncharacterized glyoxalase superfamily protein PhnB